MLFYISPSKTMNLKSLEAVPPGPYIVPKSHSDRLRRVLKKHSVKEMETFYKVSEKVASSTYEMLHMQETGCAIALFEGLVFKNLDYVTLASREKAYVAENVLIASALYGLITPLQRIMPYRLDLGSPLQIENKSLLMYWKKTINKALRSHPSELIIDLASEEYSQMLDLDYLKSHKSIVKVDFKEAREGKWVTLSTYSKMARGQFMRQAALLNCINLEDLKAINVMGYGFNSAFSDNDTLVFTR